MNILATMAALIVCLAPFGPPSVPNMAAPGTVRVLFYSPGVFDRVFARHTNPAYARRGDYVPGMYRRADADCLTAVNYNSRWMLGANVVLVVDIFDYTQKRYERHRCQASDFQQKRHSTKVQRLEIDYKTAKSVNMLRRGVTVARIVRIER